MVSYLSKLGDMKNYIKIHKNWCGPILCIFKNQNFKNLLRGVSIIVSSKYFCVVFLLEVFILYAIIGGGDIFLKFYSTGGAQEKSVSNERITAL